MLSICIPIFNSIPVDFIIEIHKQLLLSDDKGEIILCDDASSQDISSDIQKILHLKNVRIIYNSVNLGRSANRNKLAEHAKNDYLLFIDGDSGVNNQNYIQNYLPYLKQNVVCCGGTAYEKTKPEKTFMLRWKYGHLRESVPASIRNKKPYHSFTTHQFLIDRNLFLSIKFNENIKGYGHEDTIFGLALEEKGIKIIHIDNPLLHLGLESAEQFLKKSSEAIKNLAILYQNTENKTWYQEKITLIQYYHKLKNIHLLNLTTHIAYLLKKIIIKQLSGKKPQLKLFDWYKLAQFNQAMKTIKSE